MVQWKPVLTFARRRLALLDWFEANIAAVTGFTDTPEHAGIAVGRSYQKLRLDRTSLRVGLEAPQARLRPLVDALEGTWEHIEPEEALFDHYHGAWSVEVHREYEDARSRLANRCIGQPVEALTKVVDASVLMDFRTETADYKVEFGVVSPGELAERLRDVQMGMKRTRLDDRPSIDVDERDLPAASIFVDLTAHCHSPISSVLDLAAGIVHLEEEIELLVAGIGESL